MWRFYPTSFTVCEGFLTANSIHITNTHKKPQTHTLYAVCLCSTCNKFYSYLLIWNRLKIHGFLEDYLMVVLWAASACRSSWLSESIWKNCFCCLVILKSPVKLDHAFNCCCSLSPLQAMAKVTVNRFLAAVGRLMQWWISGVQCVLCFLCVLWRVLWRGKEFLLKQVLLRVWWFSALL